MDMMQRLIFIAVFVLSSAILARAADVADATGQLRIINGYRILSLKGTPEEMGAAHGRLMKFTVQRVVKAMITDGIGSDPVAYTNILRGSVTMEKFQPEEYRRELKALADAAEVKYEDLLMLQYFGDVRRCIGGAGSAALCTSFAILPPLTAANTCIVGRNFDYFDHGVGEYGSLLIVYEPKGKIPFISVTWVGVINGWTMMNRKGIVVSNDTVFAEKNKSLEGISTCFLLRHLAENAASVDEAIRLARDARRSCGAAVLVASGKPPDAAVLEFDAAGFEVRRAEGGFVGVANACLKLYRDKPGVYTGRIGRAFELANENKGKVNLTTRIADDDRVPIEGMNLHCAIIDAGALRLRVAMGKIPAFRQAFKTFQWTERGLDAVP